MSFWRRLDGVSAAGRLWVALLTNWQSTAAEMGIPTVDALGRAFEEACRVANRGAEFAGLVDINAYCAWWTGEGDPTSRLAELAPVAAAKPARLDVAYATVTLDRPAGERAREVYARAQAWVRYVDGGLADRDRRPALTAAWDDLA